MSGTALLDRLAAAGVTVRPDGDRLRLAPPDRLTPDLLELVKRNKGALLAVLRAKEPTKRFSAPDRATFERICAALRAELARRPKLAGLATYRTVLDPVTGERLTCIISARRNADRIIISEVAGDWTDPRLPDLDRWEPATLPS